MNKAAVAYIIRLLMQRIIGVGLFMLCSGGHCDLWTAEFFIAYVLIALVSGVILYRHNAHTLQERGKVNTDSPVWDKILLTAYWLLAYFGIFCVAGWQYQPMSAGGFTLGSSLYLLSTVITVWAVMENTFLESTARLQSDRNQTVCTTGPYAIVRHPTYSAILLWSVGMMFLFPSVGVMLTALLIDGIIILRTYLEDKMLKNGLSGYTDYTKQVKYRLIPHIW